MIEVIDSRVRIVLVDERNITFETYENVISPRTKETSWKWVRNGYYPTLDICIEHIKRYLVVRLLESEKEDLDIESAIRLLDRLENKYISLEFNISRENTRE